MSQLGPAFLHQPLPSFSAISWHGFERWLIEGLSILAPRSLREAGWRPAMRLCRLSSDGSFKNESVIERSVLGALRITSKTAISDELPLAIELDQSSIFETSVNLPAAAKRNIQEAVEHRLDALSPLPPSEIIFAVGKHRSIADDRLDAPIAIVKKSTLQSAMDGANENGIALVGAKPDATGAFSYVFQDRKNRGGRRGVVHPALALLAGAILLAIGANQCVDRRIAAMDENAQRLRETIVAEKSQAAFLKDAPVEVQIGLTGAELTAALEGLHESLPETAWIETIELSRDSLAATGFAPEDSKWPDSASANFNATDRPGVQRFNLVIGREASP